MENYYTINNNNRSSSDFPEKYFDSKFFKNSSSLQRLSERDSSNRKQSSFSVRLRRSSRKMNKAHRIARKSLHNSLSGSYIDESNEKSSDEEEFQMEKTSTKKPNSSHELLVPYWKNYETVNQMYLEFSETDTCVIRYEYSFSNFLNPPTY